MALLPLTEKIQQGSKRDTDEKVLVNSLGGGYEQRTVVGTNQQADMWKIDYSVLSDTDRATLAAFYQSHGRHQSFTWQAFGDTFVKTWKFASKYSETPLSGTRYAVSFSIVQVYEL